MLLSNTQFAISVKKKREESASQDVGAGTAKGATLGAEEGAVLKVGLMLEVGAVVGALVVLRPLLLQQVSAKYLPPRLVATVFLALSYGT